MAENVDSREIEYGKAVGKRHLKAMGQFFTPEAIARFVCNWACQNARNMLDPATGNGIFLREAASQYPDCHRVGYELDGDILEFFGTSQGEDIVQGDYLASSWQEKYDAIVCNPPYNRFQAVANREEILGNIYAHTGIRYAGNSNLYVLFLLKSLCQMSGTGRLAYIVPTEFLNSAYGEQVKAILLEQRLLRAVISFDSRQDVFRGANTTCCIILADREEKQDIAFYILDSVAELEGLELDHVHTDHGIWVKYGEITPQEKWRKFLFREKNASYSHLVKVEKYCRISRGIATGANGFFCLSKQKAARLDLPEACLAPCICSSRDIEGSIFRQGDFEAMAEAGKKAYLLTVSEAVNGALAEYIQAGVEQGLPQRYVLSRRKPWYSMEIQEPACILVASAYRGRLKVVRNLAGVKYLAAFHGMYIHSEYRELEEIIFCYFLTDIGQNILRSNRKELGRGLEKFQPGDIMQGQMLDVEIVSEADRTKVHEIYAGMIAKKAAEKMLREQLDKIFQPYLLMEED